MNRLFRVIGKRLEGRSINLIYKIDNNVGKPSGIVAGPALLSIFPMNLWKWVVFLSLSIGAFLSISCGSNATEQQRLARLPYWQKVEKAEDIIFIYGTAQRVNPKMSVQAATADAYGELSRILDGLLSDTAAKMLQEAGVTDSDSQEQMNGIVKRIISYSISGIITTDVETHLVGKKGKKRYASYVRIAVPQAELYKTYYLKIRENDSLYPKINSSNSFKDLESLLQIQDGALQTE